MAKEKKPSYSDYIVMHFATVALIEKSEPPLLFAYRQVYDDPNTV